MQGESLDDLMREAISKTKLSGKLISPGKGEARELTAVLLELKNPRSRLSRTESRGKIFSALGELLWYLAKSNSSSFISYYIRAYKDLSEGGRIFGGYGRRLFRWKNQNQYLNTYKQLKNNRDTRNAVIQIFDATDLASRHKENPCTCTLQFLLREGALDLVVNMRSNDLYLGFPHDVFCFTMLQEIMARHLQVELGMYKHFVGSLHYYVKDEPKIDAFLKEGWQESSIMPAMPNTSLWKQIKLILKIERVARRGKEINPRAIEALNPYWADLARLLQIYCYIRKGKTKNIDNVLKNLSSNFFHPFINTKQ